MSKKLRRRDFIKIAGSTASGLALAKMGVLGSLAQSVLGKAAPKPASLESLLPEAVSYVTSVCKACPGGCGIRVKVMDGYPRLISGNPLSPLNRSGLCPRGASGLQALYDPDRIKGPLMRVGKRGEGKWKTVSWDEAIRIAVDRLKGIRTSGRNNEVALWSGPERGTMRTLIQRFAKGFGIDRIRIAGLPHTEGMVAANYLTQGLNQVMAYDLEKTQYLLSFGAPILEGWWSPVRFLRGYGTLRGNRPQAKVVQVDSRFGVSAAKADEWLGINPGTEAALALGIGHVLVNEDLYDKDFVSRRTFGFEDWVDREGQKHEGYRTLLQRDVNMDETSRVTGIPVATISRLAKEFARAKPAIALGESSGTNATVTMLAVHSLNALTGSIEVPGGVVVPEEVPLKLQAEPEPWTPEGTPWVKEKAEAVLLLNANPLFDQAQVPGIRGWLEEAGFVLCCTPFLDETAMLADLVLPDHLYLEKWQDDPLPPVGRGSFFGLAQPVVDPRHDSKQVGDVLIALARGIGGEVGEGVPWEDFQTLVKEGVKGLADAQRGSLFDPESEEAWVERLEERGWWYPSFANPDEFWTQLTEKGGWWDPRHSFGDWGRVFRTPSGKYEFFSQLLVQEVKRRTAKGESESEILKRLGIQASGDKAYLPHHEPPRYEGGDPYPLVLRIVRTLSWGEGEWANLALLQEFPSPQIAQRWDSWVELPSEAARRIGVRDGDWVVVESPFGKAKARARVTSGLVPGVVSVPFGQGHAALGSRAKNRGANPLKLLPEAWDEISGAPAWDSVKVRILRA